MTDRVGIALLVSGQNAVSILFGFVLGKIFPHAVGKFLPPKIAADSRFDLLVGITAMYALVILIFNIALINYVCHHERIYGGYDARICEGWHTYFTVPLAWFPQIVPLLLLFAAYLTLRNHELGKRVNYSLIAVLVHVCGFALLLVRILS